MSPQFLLPLRGVAGANTPVLDYTSLYSGSYNSQHFQAHGIQQAQIKSKQHFAIYRIKSCYTSLYL